MSRVALHRWLALGCILVFVIACGRSPALPATPPATAVPASATGAPTEPSAPRPSPTPPATPTISPASLSKPAAATEPFFFGVAAGDAYRPGGLAADAATNTAYVYQGSSDAGGPALSVVDLTSGEVTRLISLGADASNVAGPVLMQPDGTLAYVLDPERKHLSVLRLPDGQQAASLPDVQTAALSPDGRRLFVSGSSEVRAYATDALDDKQPRPLWTAAAAGVNALSANAETLAATVGGAEPALVVFGAVDGLPIGRAALPDMSFGLAGGPDGGWAVRVGYPSVVLRYDAALDKIAEGDAPYGEGVFYDAARSRYLVSGPARGGSNQGLLWALDANTLERTAESAWPTGEVPDLFAAVGEAELAALPRYGGDALLRVDPATLTSRRVTPLGVTLMDMALDAARDSLYVADDQGRIHVTGLADGGVRAVWSGEGPLALDAANGRLYVNRAEGIVALDVRTGDVLATFPQRGVPAPDPARDLVYIAGPGVAMYDRAGALLGRLASTYPHESGLIPNPYTVSARVNPVTGYLVVVMNNGVPGSNNRTFLRVYPPMQDVPSEPPDPSAFVQDLAFDPESGSVYVSHHPTFNLEALQMLSSVGQEIDRLGGRSGALAFDPATRTLYALEDGALARLDGDTLELESISRAPVGRQLALDPERRTLYVRDDSGPRLRVLPLEGVQPLEMRPEAASLPAEAMVRGLAFGQHAGRTLLYLTDSNNLTYRADVTAVTSGDGLNWERLPEGSWPQWGYLTALDDGVIFRAGMGGAGADGAWRSTDGGDTWQLLAEGLADLRTGQAIPARSAEEAYFASHTAGLYAWRDAAGRWERIVVPISADDWPGALSLAPDGTLFLQTYGQLWRSGDGGGSWRSLPLAQGVDNGTLAGFHPDYARNKMLFALFCTLDVCAVQRSQDAGDSWAPVLPLQAFGTPLALLAEPGQPLYLYNSGYPEPQLYRSQDDGATWAAAGAAMLTDVGAVGLAPDGALWLGGKGGVRRVDAASLGWTPIGSDSRTAAGAAPTTAPLPTGTPGVDRVQRCTRDLSTLDRKTAAAAPDLGCPVDAPRAVHMARQPFERGQMIWESDRRSVLVLTDDGAWQGFEDTWKEGQPESAPELIAPAGLLQPMRGFGKVWRERLGGEGAAVGWAREAEQGVTGERQSWDHGNLLRFGRQWFALYEDGRWEGFSEP